MINAKTTIPSLLVACALGFGFAACSPDPIGGGGAYLTVQGEASLALEPGFQRDLTVKYHDAAGNALAGEVTFEILGEKKGSNLSQAFGATDASGFANLTVYAGQDETVFRIKASAEFAESVEWTVSISEGEVAEDMDIRGTYSVTSAFDVVNGLPGNIGTVVNILVDLTDDPYDPATYLIDSFDESGSISGFRPAVDAVVFNLINDNAPTIVQDFLDLGKAFGEVTKNFGVLSTMVISGDNIEGTNMKAVHTINAYQFTLDGETHIFTMDDLNIDEDVVENIAVDYDNHTGVGIFAEQEVPLRYGGFLVMALEDVIIPRFEPNARSLNQFMEARIDCDAVGQAILDTVNLFNLPTWVNACHVSIQAVSSIIIENLREIDEQGQVKLIITGKARFRDPSGDGQADKMTRGDWSGNMDYLGSQGPLADGSNPFSGERSNVN